MAKFILEIGTEELPARFLVGLEISLKSMFIDALEDNYLTFSAVNIASTPRRLVVIVDGLPACQDDRTELISGPPKRIAYNDGKITQAGLGFLKTQNIKESDLHILSTVKGEYLAVNKVHKGRATSFVLADICVEIITNLPFPKKMYWGIKELHFGRPVRWIMALLDTQIVPFKIGTLSSSNFTFGHRVMSSGMIEIENVASYKDIIKEKAFVILENNKRKDIIVNEAERLANEINAEILWSDNLLNIVANLVEYPKVILGSFDSKFLELPEDVLLTSMEVHQKSFGLRGSDGKLMPYFLTIINLEPENLSIVQKGWERVLRARLEDALFFYKQDLSKQNFDNWLSKLDKVIFIANAGTMADKSKRLKRLVFHLAQIIAPEKKEELAQAGAFAKADLVSGMVGEFDELQGKMGALYAKKWGESELICNALYEQYLPAGAETSIPQTVEGAILSLADKIDSIIACFGMGYMPTGSADPYAVRRQTIGIIRIIEHFEFRFNIWDAFEFAKQGFFEIKWKLNSEDTHNLLIDFFTQRLQVYFCAKSISPNVVTAAIQALPFGMSYNDITDLKMRIEALEKFTKLPSFEQSVLIFKRVISIVKKTDIVSLAGLEIDENLFLDDYEKKLFNNYKELDAVINNIKVFTLENYNKIFEQLEQLHFSVESFFDNVIVMSEDEKLQRNRLILLILLANCMSNIANFSAFQI